MNNCINDVLKAIRDRRSIRRFKPEPISDHLINVLLESARLAPSGTNSQPWRFVVVKDEDTKKKLQLAANNQRHVGAAPVVIVCCADLELFRNSPNVLMN